MNIDEIKANAPDGATHIDHIGCYWDFNAKPIPLIWSGVDWVQDHTQYAKIFKPL